MPWIISWKERKAKKKDLDRKKSKKSKEVNALLTYVKKRVAFEKNKEAEAAREEELNNFKNMLLDDLPKDGKIDDDNEWKTGPGKRRKGAYKSKKHVFNTLDECINESYFSFNAHLKGQSLKNKKTLLQSGKGG